MPLRNARGISSARSSVRRLLPAGPSAGDNAGPPAGADHPRRLRPTIDGQHATACTTPPEQVPLDPGMAEVGDLLALPARSTRLHFVRVLEEANANLFFNQTFIRFNRMDEPFQRPILK